MLVSVLLPAYNAEKTIAATIESVLSQTHQSFELLVIDDGSTDDTNALIEGFAKRDNRIRVISHANWGMGASLNHAMSMAGSDWIVRMDADDIMTPSRLERQISFVGEHPGLAVASCLVYYIDGNSRIIGINSSNLKTRSDFEHCVRSGELIGFHHPGVIMDRAVVMSVGGYRPQFWPADDLDLWNRIAERGHLILVQQAYLLKYRIHSASISISRARMARLKVRWAKACMMGRRAGLPEPSFDEFQRIENERPLWARINRERKDMAKVLYKRAVHSFSRRHYFRSIMPLAGSILLQPTYGINQISTKSVLVNRRVDTFPPSASPSLGGRDRGGKGSGAHHL